MVSITYCKAATALFIMEWPRLVWSVGSFRLIPTKSGATARPVNNKRPRLALKDHILDAWDFQ